MHEYHIFILYCNKYVMNMHAQNICSDCTFVGKTGGLAL